MEKLRKYLNWLGYIFFILAIADGFVGWRMQKIDGNLNSQSARAVMGMLFILPALAFICWHSMGVLVGRMSLKFGRIERNRNPYQFWYLVISGYVVLLATVVFGLLVCVGILGHFD